MKELIKEITDLVEEAYELEPDLLTTPVTKRTERQDKLSQVLQALVLNKSFLQIAPIDEEIEQEIREEIIECRTRIAKLKGIIIL